MKNLKVLEQANAINNSVVKAFDILDQFTIEKPQWGVRELAQTLRANSSTTYRILATLHHLGALKKDPISEKYSLSLKLFELGNRVDINNTFIAKTHPVLENVAKEITETVHLGILKNYKVLMIDIVESPLGLKLNSNIGSHSPAYCTGQGKMMLSQYDKKELDPYIQSETFKRLTPYTICDKKKFVKELDIIKEQGFALDKEEKEEGLICVAVPVYNDNNKMIASLSAAGPAQRFKFEKLNEYVEILNHGALDIKRAIGEVDPYQYF